MEKVCKNQQKEEKAACRSEMAGVMRACAGLVGSKSENVEKSEDATIAYSDRCGGCCDCGKYRQSLHEIGNGIIEFSILGGCEI